MKETKDLNKRIIEKSIDTLKYNNQDFALIKNKKFLSY